MTEQSQSKSPKRTSSNRVLEATSFLNGTNAAFVEALCPLSEQSRLGRRNWRAFFDAWANRGSRRPSWATARPGSRDNSHAAEPNELLSALTGDWRQRSAEKRPAAAVPVRGGRATRKASIRAVQMIRAYRMIGHLEADLDPLELETRKPQPQLEPSFYGFHERRSRHARSYIDGIMGFDTATPRQLVEILRAPIAAASATSSCTSTMPSRRTGCSAASKAREQDHLHARRQEGDPEQADRGRRLREILRRPIRRHQALRPGRRAKPPSRRWSRSSSAAASWA